jgi:lysophospholipase L1-like esterase
MFVRRNLPWLLTGILALLLIGSLAANWLLFIYAQEYYTSLQMTRLDPLGLSYFSDTAVTHKTDKVTAVFFGDSRAAQWPAPDGLPDIHFVNRGIGAQTSAQIVERFDEHVRPLQPDILIVQMCINDLKTIPLFPHSSEQIVATCQQNIRQVVEQASAMGTTVILTTIFPIGDFPIERRLYWSPEIETAVTEVNAYIQTLAIENVHILDAHTLLADESGKLRSEFATDELHLNATGYTQLNTALSQTLTEITK